MTKWMAEKLSSSIQGESRKFFLKQFLENPDFVVAVFSRNVEPLIMEYAMYQSENVLILNASAGDPNVFVSQAKKIVEYMRDELLKEELAPA